MTKKFAVLAVLATMFVACGGPSAAELEAKAKATADSLAADSTAKAMAEQARLDSIARAAADTMKTMVDSAAATVTGH